MALWRDNIGRMAGYVPGEQPKDRRYIKLNTNENPYPPSPRALAALAAFPGDRLRLYPDPVADALRDTAARVYGLPGRDWVLAGNGSDDLLTIAVRTFVDQGGALAHPEPSYSLYPVLAGLQAARAVAVPLDAAFALPADAAAQATAAGASLFFLARPNAPTGNVTPRAAVEKLCREFAGVVWIDEAYGDFAPDHCLDFPVRFPNVVVSRTFSKSYSLAGVRLGLALACPELIGQMFKVKDSYNVNVLTQVVGEAALADQEYLRDRVAVIRGTRDRMAAALVAMGCVVCPSASNFLFVNPVRISAAAAFSGLRERGLLVRYFPGPRTGDYLRISVGTDAEMAALLAAMRELARAG